MLMPRTVLAGQMLAAVVVVLAAFTGVHGACPAEDAVTPAPPGASRFTLPSCCPARHHAARRCGPKSCSQALRLTPVGPLVQDAHLTASGYTISATDTDKATAAENTAEKTSGSVDLADDFTFADPETTGQTIAAGGVKATIKCATVANFGCSGESKADQSAKTSFCVGCSANPTVTVAGLGAWEAHGNHAGWSEDPKTVSSSISVANAGACSCSDTGQVQLDQNGGVVPLYRPAAANTHYITAHSRCSLGADDLCSDNLDGKCATACSCSTAAVASNVHNFEVTSKVDPGTADTGGLTIGDAKIAFFDKTGTGNEGVIAFEEVAGSTALIAAQETSDSNVITCEDKTASAYIAYEDTTDTGTVATEAAADATSLTLKDQAITNLAQNDFIKIGTEYLKVTNINGLTLTVDRATVPANSDLTSTAAATIAVDATVTRMSGGVDTAGTTVTLVAALTGLAQNDFIKTAAGEYMKVTNIANDVTLTVERNAAPAGLIQRSQAASAGPGTQVTLAQGGITDDATATTVKLVGAIANLAQNEYIKIGDEYMKVTGLADDDKTLTVTRLPDVTALGLTEAAGRISAAPGAEVKRVAGFDASSTTLKLVTKIEAAGAAIGTLAKDEYIKIGNEYMKVTADLADDGKTLTVSRNANPPGLTSGGPAVVAAGATVTLVEGGLSVDGTTLKLVSAIANLQVNEYVKTPGGEYLKVTQINGQTLTVERSDNTDAASATNHPPGLTQGAKAAVTLAGVTVTLAEGGISTSDTTLYIANAIDSLDVNEYLKIGVEIVKVTALSDDKKTLTIQRAQSPQGLTSEQAASAVGGAQVNLVQRPDCQCSCRTNYCNTMQADHTVAASPGNNCTCDSDGVASGATGSDIVGANAGCGCSCQRNDYTCQCHRKTCGSTTSSDGKTFTATNGESTFGGGTCTVTAACAAGFYDGGVYSAYNTTSNVQAELFLENDAGDSESALESRASEASRHLDGTTPTAAAAGGVFTFNSLEVKNYISHAAKLKLKIHAGASFSKVLSSAFTAKFKAWPLRFKVVRTGTTVEQMTEREYKVTATGVANLGDYDLYFIDSDGNTISRGVATGFTASPELVTGKDPTTQLPDSSRDNDLWENKLKSQHANLAHLTTGFFVMSGAGNQANVATTAADDATTLVLDAEITNLDVDDYVKVGNEYMKVTAIAADKITLTVERGAAPHRLTQGNAAEASEGAVVNLVEARFQNDLIVLNRDSKRSTPDVDASISDRVVTVTDAQDDGSMGMATTFRLHVQQQVGKAFAIVFTSTTITQSEQQFAMKAANNYNWYFGITPGKISMAYGNGSTLYGANSAPYVVKVDGGGTNETTKNLDGLPKILHVVFQDQASNPGTLSHGYCTQCVMVRLIRCTESTADATSVSSSSDVWPACSGTTPASSLVSGVSSSAILTGTTVVNMVDGVATFENVQIKASIGAGYRLQFTLNSGGRHSTNFHPSSPRCGYYTCSNQADNRVDFPSAETSAKLSFFIRPYALTLVQEIGGDGVDNNGDGTSDGVGNGHVFGNQPMVALRGNGYNFTTNNGMGYTPITAKVKSCDGASCAGKGMTLSCGEPFQPAASGQVSTSNCQTPPVWKYKRQVFEAGGINGTWADQVTMQSSASPSISGSRLLMMWRDLKIDAGEVDGVYDSPRSTWQKSVKLKFEVGPEIDCAYSALGETCTTVDSNVFDVFSYPEPPRNLRAHSYDEGGFRLEFDPAPPSNAQPLTGYIVEVDVCEQDATRCMKRGTATSKVCTAVLAKSPSVRTATENATCFTSSDGLGRGELNAGPFGFEVGLSSDFVTGGGHTEDVVIHYMESTTKDVKPNAGAFAAIKLQLSPSRILYKGDKLRLDFGKSYKFSPLNQVPTDCSLTGANAALFELERNGNVTLENILTLTVISVNPLPPSKILTIIIPEGCKIKAPPMEPGLTEPTPPPTVLHAAVLTDEFSSRGDNCKGSTKANNGCTAKTTYVLPTIQDGNEKDTEWDGVLNKGGSWSYQTDPTCTSSCTYNNVLQPTTGFWTTATKKAVSDQCRAGQSQAGLCALPIGEDWGMGVDVSLDWSPAADVDFSAISDPKISVSFKRDRALAKGDKISFQIPGLAITQPSSSLCAEMKENMTFWNPANATANATAPDPCHVFKTKVTTALGLKTHNVPSDRLQPRTNISHSLIWKTTFAVSTSTFSIEVGDAETAGTPITVVIYGFSATTAAKTLLQSQTSIPLDASVLRTGRTTLIFRNGSETMTYAQVTGTGGGAVQRQLHSSKIGGSSSDTYPDPLKIHAGDICSFRIYSYNGRFRSKDYATVAVQNRVIQKPKKPITFTQIKQNQFELKIRFENLPSGFVTEKTSAIRPPLGTASRIGIQFTPDRHVREKSVLSIPLKTFTHQQGYFRFSNLSLLTDEYDIQGQVTFTRNESLTTDQHTLPWAHGCSCTAAGTVIVPSTKYRATRSCMGSGCQNFTSSGWQDDEISGLPSPGRVPAGACGECTCDSSGVASAPATIYNTTGACSSCSCSADGVSTDTGTYEDVPAETAKLNAPIDDLTTSKTVQLKTAIANLDVGEYIKTASGEYMKVTVKSQDGKTLTVVRNAAPAGLIQNTTRPAANNSDVILAQLKDCNCSCPIFRKCTCGCEVYEQYSCACRQTKAHKTFTNALWSTSEETLMLTVAQGKELITGRREVVWISKDTGIKLPAEVEDFEAYWPEPTADADGVMPWGFEGAAQLESFKLNWMSSFPTLVAPRLGFVVQFTTDYQWKTNIQTIFVPDDLSQGVIGPKVDFDRLKEKIDKTTRVLKLMGDASRIKEGQHIQIDDEICKVIKSNPSAVSEVKTGTVAANGALTDQADSTTLKLDAAISGLVQNDHVQTAAGEFLKVTNVTGAGKTLTVARDQALPGLIRKGALAAAAEGEMIKLVEASSLIVLRGYAGTKKFVSGHDALAAVALVTAGASDPDVKGGVEAIETDDIARYPFKARVYNSVEINAQETPLVSMVASCDGGNSTTCGFSQMSACKCCSGEDSCNALETGRNPAVPSEPSLSPKGVQTVAGADIGSPRKKGFVQFSSAGDVLSYPLDFRGRLNLKMSPTSSVLTLENPPKSIAGDPIAIDELSSSGVYVRIDDEIMKVRASTRPTRGVVSINVFRSFGGQHCTCSIGGIVGTTNSDGDTTGCSCSSKHTKDGVKSEYGQGTGCTANGVLVAKQGSGGPGRGFKAEFTVGGGKVTSITIVNPGENYTQAPEIMISEGGVTTESNFQYLGGANPIPIKYVVTTGTTAAERGVIAADGALTDAADSLTLKVNAAITNLDIGEYLKTANGEYLQVKALSEDRKTITVGRDAAPKGLTQKGSKAAADAASNVQLVELPPSCNVNFWATLATADFRKQPGLQTAGVFRGQLGTRAVEHSVSSKVYAVHWAGSELIDATYAPSRRYNFRVAAYNKAGFSPFVYYDFELKRIPSTRFRPFGGQNFEIELVGGGAEAKPSDYKVFFVPAPLGYDVTLGKECTGATVTDLAGTKLTCKTPSWVGAKFNIVIKSDSGIFQRIAKGGENRFQYLPPEVIKVEPTLLEMIDEDTDIDEASTIMHYRYRPREPVIITITGENFGRNDSLVQGDVRGYLRGGKFTKKNGFPDGLPCTPLVVATDKQAFCTLLPKSKNDVLEGDIIIEAGNQVAWNVNPTPGFWNSQLSKPTDEARLLAFTAEDREKARIKSTPVKVTSRIEKDFDEVVGTPEKEQAFKAGFAKDTAAALEVPESRIEVTELQKGSIVVLFNIIPDLTSTTAVSPASLAVALAVQAADPNSALNTGSFTSGMAVALPAGVEEMAAAEATTSETTEGVIPKYFSQCIPQSYSAWDMEICFNCCTYLCETGTEVPQSGGQDVLPGFRAQVCQGECMNHCGYGRAIS